LSYNLIAADFLAKTSKKKAPAEARAEIKTIIF
jgi:hypothetical protein